MCPPGGTGTGAVSQSIWFDVGMNGRGVTLGSACKTANETSMRIEPPQPLVCSAPMIAADSLSTGAFEMSW